MRGLVTDHHHYSAEQVREYIARAVALVGELEVPDDLRAAAFVKACDLLASKSQVMEQVAVGVPTMDVPRARQGR